MSDYYNPEQSMKTHASNKHHIHNLKDCEDLIRQKGYEIGRSYDHESECYADSKQMARGMRATPAMSVRLYKRSQRLKVSYPNK